MAWATHSFTLILANDVPITDDVAEKLYDVCDDTLLGMCNGAAYVDIDREADSFRDAALSAITEVESVGLRVERVEPGDFVTAAEIARRSGRSRESIRQLIGAERGPGSFPPPVSSVTTRSPLWRWSDVAAWLAQQKMLPAEEVDRALFTASVNASLDWRRVAQTPVAEDISCLLLHSIGQRESPVVAVVQATFVNLTDISESSWYRETLTPPPAQRFRGTPQTALAGASEASARFVLK